MNILKAILKHVPWQILVGLMVVGAAGGYVMHLQGELQDERDRNYSLALYTDSIEVASDTLRNVTEEINAALERQSDSANFYRRRSLQASLELDSIGVALNASVRLNASLEASIDTLRTTLTSTTTEEGENRLATFEEYLQPYTVKMEISLPPAPGLGTAEIEVALDPVRLRSRVFCGDRSDLTGLRPAEILIETPSWMTLSGVDVIQERDVCNPPPLEIPFYRSWKMGAVGASAIFTTILGVVFIF